MAARWNNAELKFLRLMYRRGDTDRNIGNAIGRTTGAVASKRSKIKIVKYQKMKKKDSNMQQINFQRALMQPAQTKGPTLDEIDNSVFLINTRLGPVQYQREQAAQGDYTDEKSNLGIANVPGAMTIDETIGGTGISGAGDVEISLQDGQIKVLSKGMAPRQIAKVLAEILLKIL